MRPRPALSASSVPSASSASSAPSAPSAPIRIRSAALAGVAALAVLALVALPAPARADEPIVLESYAGERPADAEAVLLPVIDELAKNRFVVGPAVVGRRFEAAVSRPALSGGLPQGFSDAVTRGFDLWSNGKFDEAAAVLGPLVEAARGNPGELARDSSETLYPQLQRAMIALALSQLRLGDRGAAKQTLAEALRGNPDLKLSRGMYGQDASALFDEVFRELTERGRGKVIIDAGDAGIYVNERLVGMGRRELYLLPGEYRVVARLGAEVSRAHRVAIAGGDIHQLDIDPDFDRAVRTQPGWTGFSFATSADRARDEQRHAAAFATAIDAAQVVVLGIDTVRGRRLIRGALVNKSNGREFRSGSLPLDASPSEEQRRNLARFLNGAPAAPEIIVNEAPGPGGPRGPHDRVERPPWAGWKWIAGGAALAAGAAGGVFLAYDGRCANQVEPGVPCPNRYDTAVQGWVAVGGAVALAGVTAYLVVRERRGGGGGGGDRAAYVAPAPGGALAGVAGRF
jgi:hypothetical protein